ncbi:leucine--tRNA ligase [Candidatus Pacearchaeota archaeon]|nr:leucine--tRNA ligase [Candidatus Pacearchaeota archaeon]
MADFDFKKIEQKWQKEWEKQGAFKAKEGKKDKFYCLEMFPYPSASYLHMGHVKCYSIGDIIARFKRMQGKNVLYPMGFDAFGLPAENAAIKAKSHPATYTNDAIATIRKLMKELGLSYDWDREVSTHLPDYYRWNQWIFLKMLEKGIAYRKKAPVNYCKTCATTLANEEVIDGNCWRCDQPVSLEQLEQWFFKITAYADELLSGLDTLQWNERVKEMQRNWIGKSEGTKVTFILEGTKQSFEVFTTRPDTLYGVTFLTCAARHPLLGDLLKGTPQEKAYRSFLQTVSASEKLDVTKEKEGFNTGLFALHPLTGERLPIFASNFVVADYGTGFVMGVPAHDQRDFDFAQKYALPIKQVICQVNGKIDKKMKEAYIGRGILIDSDTFDGLENEKAKKVISAHLVKLKKGAITTEYRLRDWLVSRQRYWGTPIPIVYCSKCGIVPVPEKQLPVQLPVDVTFTGKGNPLVTCKAFVETSCPTCKGKAKRETDTMATFIDSSWYYLRYCDPDNKKALFDSKKVAYWMPADQYIGGMEHAVLHLLYARFFTKFLRDCGLVTFDEPFQKLFNQGIVHKGGERMSKSHGNTVTAEEISAKYGIDTARLFIMFVASPDKAIEWDDKGIEGAFKVIKRFIALADKVGKVSDPIVDHKIASFLTQLEKNYESIEFNKGIVSFMELVSSLSEKESISRAAYESLLLGMSPIIPHVCEELWSRLGNKTLIATESWPKVDTSKINPAFDVVEQAVEKTVSDIMNVLRLVKEKTGEEGTQVYVYVLPKEVGNYAPDSLTKRVGKPIRVFAVNDPKKYDPQGKAGKAKPGKPALFVE